MNSGTLFAYFVTFTASFCMMVIELVAGRIMAPYIGQHLYSWTSIIGVCLAGISIGAWLGGWMADKFPRRGTLGWFLFFGGVLAMAIPLLTDTICNIQLFDRNSVSLMVRIVVYTTIIFLPAMIFLGMISPMVIKLVVRDLNNTGSIVGRIYSFSTLGSIIGTFVTGFYLVENFGTRILLYGVGVILILMAPLAGGLFLRAGKYVGCILIGIVLALSIVATQFPEKYKKVKTQLTEVLGQPMYLKPLYLFNNSNDSGGNYYSKTPYWKESSYYTLRVGQHDDHADSVTGEMRSVNDLILDNLVHSHSDLADPSYLSYDYLRIYEELVGWQLKKKGTTKHSELFIGGGGYTLQRYFHHLYKDCYIDVAEIDPLVTDVAEKFMGAPKGDPRLVTKNVDGRLFVMDKQKTDDKYDFIFGDAFNDLSVPFHLTTLEFDNQINNLLTPNGLVMSLVIDQVGQGLFLPSFIATMRKSFGDENVVLIIIEDPALRQDMISYLKKRKLDKYLDRLGKESLDGVTNELLIEAFNADQMQEFAGRLAGETADKVIPDFLKAYLDKQKSDSVIKQLTDLVTEGYYWEEIVKQMHAGKHQTKSIEALRLVIELRSKKVDDYAPYLKPTNLDYIAHSTVIVVGSKTKQDWKDFNNYLKELEKTFKETKSSKQVTSNVISPEELTEYLNTRTKEATGMETWFKGKGRFPWTPVVLTDDFAPVDNLTAPVFEKKFGYKKQNRALKKIEPTEDDALLERLIEDIKK